MDKTSVLNISQICWLAQKNLEQVLSNTNSADNLGVFTLIIAVCFCKTTLDVQLNLENLSSRELHKIRYKKLHT